MAYKKNRFHTVKKVDKNGKQIKDWKTWRGKHPKALYFDSRLEYSTHALLEKEGMTFKFHPDMLTVQEKFKLKSFEKGELKERGIRKIGYTVDFIVYANGKEYHVETKGLAEEVFKIRWKVFLNLVKDDSNIVPCLVFSVKEMQVLIKAIKKDN